MRDSAPGHGHQKPPSSQSPGNFTSFMTPQFIQAATYERHHNSRLPSEKLCISTGLESLLCDLLSNRRESGVFVK